MRVPSLAGLVLIAAGCSTTRVYVAPELADATDDTLAAPAPGDIGPPAVTHRVLLVGDTGEPASDGPDPVLATLRHHAEAAGQASTVVFLGDNVYPDGLPPEGDPGRQEAERRLRVWLDAAGAFPGRTLFIPGNHDWRNATAGGLEQLRRQEAFVEAALGAGSFIPSGGFPGPVTVDLTEDLRLLAVDTEWWLAQHARAEGEDPEVGDFFGEDDDFLLSLADAIERADDRRVLVVGHHPMVSNGDHAGYVPAERHLFPMAGSGPLGWVPMPFLGSLIVALKRFQGDTPEDIAHPRYRALTEAMWEAMSDSDGLVYAAAHDHSLQYFALDERRATIHQVISGAGSTAKIEYVLPRDALFAASRPGFMVLTYYEDGTARLDVITPTTSGPAGDTLVSAQILEPEPAIAPPPDAGSGIAPALPATATLPVAPGYAGRGLLTAPLVGSGYRDAWTTPVTLPVLDVGREVGGLAPERHAGSRQSLSARLSGADGREYVLRSVEKDLPRPLARGRTPGSASGGGDLRVALYPFASVVAASLSEAAGLYHPNPRLFVVPDDPRLGGLREAFRGRVATLEEHPADGPTGRAHFGNARQIVGTIQLRRDLDRHPDHRVDAEFYLRARLFDMLIGDFDRHRDQWRWAAFEPRDLGLLTRATGTVYRPIARDRDYAFHDPNGFLIPIASHFDPRLRGFGGDIGSVGMLTESAREMDRRLLAPLDRETWARIARDLRDAITDAEINAALEAVPAEARDDARVRLLDPLISRRDGLEAAALRYFDLINSVADVVGSHSAETFHVRREPGGVVRVELRTEEAGTSWSRLYDPSETREIRIWGRGGNDRIEVEGPSSSDDIVLRLLPGAGMDRIVDATDGQRIDVYDSADDEALVVERAGPAADVDRTNRVPQSAFGYAAPRYTTRRPLATLSYDAADGLLVGAGVEITNPGFGREPFLRRHRIQAAVATTTLGGYVRYRGSYPDAVGKRDVGLDASAQTALSSRNFFGFGTGTELIADAPPEFYRVGLAEVRLAPYLERQVRGGVRAWAGPTVAFVSPQVDSARFISTAGLPERDLSPQVLAGIEAGIEIDAVDDVARPTNGARFGVRAQLRQGLVDPDHSYAGASTDLALYITPPSLRWLTLALRGGGEHLWGTFPFYDAATIGGSGSLRGFRSDRFTGQTSVYAGVEPRLRLHRFRTLLSSYGEAGILGFYERGRVWADDGVGNWPAGYGAGVWLAFPGHASTTLTYDASREGGSLAARLGFAF